MQIIANFDLFLHQTDFKVAQLDTLITWDISISQPRGNKKFDNNDKKINVEIK